MYPEEARISGALPGEMRNSDLRPHPRPRAATNPEWYAAAVKAAPKDMGSTARRGWVEGFVAALELARDVGLI